MKKISASDYIKTCKKLHNDKYNYSKINLINQSSKITIICPIHGEFEQIAHDHKNGHGCPKCAIDVNTKKKRNKLEDLIKRANIIHDNFYNYDKIKEHKNMHTKVTLTCPEHGDFEQTLGMHINKKRGCPKCSIENRTGTKVNFLIKSRQVHGEKYNYDKVNYINSRTKIIITCPKHGNFEQRPRDHINNKQGCPICKESKGENMISNLLKNKKIDFEYQKKFKDCFYKNNLFFDFYLPKYNTCIEYDGEQHFKVIEYWGGENGLEQRKKRDKIKNEYCKNNDINLIRIKYDEDIESIKNKLIL